MGLDRREEPRLQGHDVRRRPGRREHRQHHAGEDPATPSRTTARSSATRSGRNYDDARAGDEGPRRRRHRLRRRDRDARAGGRRQVREVLERAARDRRAEPRRGPATVTDWSTIAGDGFELFFGYRDEQAFVDAVEQLVADGVASGIAAQDATLWGPDAESEAGKRLAWVGLAQESRPLVDEIVGLRDVLADRGCTRVVLCGMGGSSLAPEVICATHGVELTVLDSSDPDYVRRALGDRPRAAPSWSCRASPAAPSRPTARSAPTSRRSRDADLEPRGAHHRRHRPGLAARRVRHRGRLPRLPRRPRRRRPLLGADRVRAGAERARRRRHRPAARRGGSDPAARSRPTTPTTPGCGSVPCSAWPTRPASTSWCWPTTARGIPGFGDWAEQLIAESTGKDGKGILPVVVPSLDAPNFAPSTRRRGARRRSAPAAPTSTRRPPRAGAPRVDAAAGRAAAAVGVRHRGRRPDHRHQPVRPARRRERQAGRSRHARGRRRPAPTPAFTDGPVEVYATDGLLAGESTVADAVATLLGQLDGEHGYLAVMAYLDRAARRAHLADVREQPRRAHRPADHVRLGTAVPALDRAVPQGRAADRRLPPDHRRAAGGPRDPRPAVHLRRLHQRPGGRRRLACSPTTDGPCSGCTSPTRRPALSACCGRPLR